MKVQITLVVDVDETDEVICPDGKPLEQNCILNAVDNDLMRDEHPAMPISKERKTQVSFGRGNKS